MLKPDPTPDFPFLCLTVSGGHTQLVRVDNPSSMTVLGHTLDDAAGEAFDKVAKLIGLPYPGGPVVDRLAKAGDPHAFSFTKPKVPDLHWSFSGLKTQVLQFLQKEMAQDDSFVETRKEDLCASIQRVIVDMLMDEVAKAVECTGIRHVAIAGGVSANSGLRDALTTWGARSNVSIYLPPFEYTTDNAAMIGIAGYYQYLQGANAPLSTSAQAKLKF